MAEDTQLEPGIVANPLRQGGRPTLAGTRITVELVLDKLAADQTIDEVLADYPHLAREQVLNAIAYAAQLVHSQQAGTISEVANIRSVRRRSLSALPQMRGN